MLEKNIWYSCGAGGDWFLCDDSQLHIVCLTRWLMQMSCLYCFFFCPGAATVWPDAV